MPWDATCICRRGSLFPRPATLHVEHLHVAFAVRCGRGLLRGQSVVPLAWAFGGRPALVLTTPAARTINHTAIAYKHACISPLKHRHSKPFPLSLAATA